MDWETAIRAHIISSTRTGKKIMFRSIFWEELWLSDPDHHFEILQNRTLQNSWAPRLLISIRVRESIRARARDRVYTQRSKFTVPVPSLPVYTSTLELRKNSARLYGWYTLVHIRIYIVRLIHAYKSPVLKYFKSTDYCHCHRPSYRLCTVNLCAPRCASVDAGYNFTSFMLPAGRRYHCLNCAGSLSKHAR